MQALLALCMTRHVTHSYWCVSFDQQCMRKHVQQRRRHQDHPHIARWVRHAALIGLCQMCVTFVHTNTLLP
jgi:hypothetical protein